MKKLLVTLSVLALAAGCMSKQKRQEVAVAKATVEFGPLPTTLEEAVSSNRRTPENTARDKYRHPVETLKFFGIKPNMTVVEIWPSAGWYTEIIAPYLATNGKYIAATFDATTPYMSEYDKKMKRWLDNHADVASKITVTNFMPPDRTEIAPAGTADMVVTFRNVHNWTGKKAEQAAFNAFYKALKPGGILGVEEHRSKKGTKFNPDDKSGYVPTSYVIKIAQKAGFRLVAKSEINANPADTKDYPEGVWTLPPSLKLGDKDREKYLAIGESDRMTLKFMKPKNAKK